MSTTGQRTCPVCTSQLEPYDHEGVQLDRCPNGCGLWLDRGELPRVIHSEQTARDDAERHQAVEAAARDAGHAVVAEVARERRACPVCGSELRLAEYARSGVPIDECPSRHGIWLDAGELERIEAYAEGIRRQARPGAASGGGIRGIDVPDDILATISGAAAKAPPPPPGD